MKLTVTACDFTLNEPWLFTLTAGEALYYIMNESFYKKHKLKSPLIRPILDSLDKGWTVNAEVKHVDGINLVVKIIDFHF